MDSKWLTISGRALALAWALWWTLFGLMEGIGEGIGLIGAVMHTIMPGAIFLLAAVLGWRWEPWGTIPLFVLGAWALLAYDFARTVDGLLVLSLPPVAAGGLLLAGWWAGAKYSAPGTA